MFKISRIVASGCVFACLLWGQTAVHAADLPSKKPKYDINQPLGERFVANTAVVESQSRLVVFRSANASANGVVSVYFDDKYHVSLQANAFSVICFDTDKIDMRSRLIPADAEALPDADARQSLALKKGVTQFVRIETLADGRTQLQEVPTRIAQADLQEAQQQMHTRSRVAHARACKEIKTVGPQVPNIITFGADAIFKPQKTLLKDLTPASKDGLDKVVEKINKKYAAAAAVKVHVVGYADEASDEITNQRLSAARAQAVRQYLLQNGLQNSEITEESKVVKSQDKLTPLSNPNRRVSIEVLVTTL